MRKTEDIDFGEYILRIQQTKDGFVGIVVGNANSRFFDETKDGLIAKLQHAAGQTRAGFVGYEGAVRRFTDLFPKGFNDVNYIGDSSFGEKFYKRQMSSKLREQFPLNSWWSVPAPQETGLHMFRNTNLVDPFTKTALQNVLRSEKGMRFLEICSEFAKGEINRACKALTREFKAEGVAKWPALTYLPFFWKPSEHMFLKPQFTKEYAERVGHPFTVAYESDVNEDTYASLMDLSAETKANLGGIEGSERIDNIDIHSFMWVVIDYDESDVGPEDD